MDSEGMEDLVATGDVETVKQKIQEKYGFTPTDEYVKDLIQFVNDMVAGVEDDDADLAGEDDNDYPEG